MNKVLKITIAVVLCLIVILSVALIVSQCKGKKNPDTTTTTTTTTTTSTTKPNGGDPEPDCSHVDADYNSVCDKCGDTIEGIFTPTNDTVYVISTELNVRKTPEVPEDNYSNVFCSKHMDDELHRTGYNDDWTRIEIDGLSYYVSTPAVTTQKPITEFDDCDETVFFTQNAYAMTKPSYLDGYSQQIDTFFKGESIKRTGVAKVAYVDTDGTEYIFARIEYTVKVDGVDTPRISYVNNAYLTTEAPSNDGDVVFENNNEILVSKLESFWLRKSTIYEDSEKALKIPQGTILQAIGYGVESDNTQWYKVLYQGEVYYVIYKDTYFDKIDDYDKTFEGLFGEYNITVPMQYEIISATDSEYAISNGSLSINVVNTGALPEETTAQFFAAAMIEQMQLLGVEVQENEGIVYFEFSTTVTIGNQTSTAYCLVAFTQGSNNNFYVTTIVGEGAKADLSDIFWRYLNTIEISPIA